MAVILGQSLLENEANAEREAELKLPGEGRKERVLMTPPEHLGPAIPEANAFWT